MDGIRWLIALIVAFFLAAGVLVTRPGGFFGAEACDFSPPDTVRFGGVTYGRQPDAPRYRLTRESLGPLFATVERYPAIADDCDIRLKDSEAWFLAVGTRLYPVAGYHPTFRLAAEEYGRFALYQVFTSDTARRGSDLLDIDGKVTTIAVKPGLTAENYNDPQERERSLAVIADPIQIASLVDQLRGAPVDSDRANEAIDDAPSAGGFLPMYNLDFSLTDGTSVGQQYFWFHGVFRNGIVPPAAFRDVILRALIDEKGLPPESAAPPTPAE